MAKKNKRVPIAANVPSGPSKVPRAQPIENFYNLHPAWRISLVEMCDPFGWHEIHKDKLAEIRKKLADLEKSTWREILMDSKKQNHSISVDKLSKEARRRLTALKQEDVENVISLRLSGAERVFGIRHNIALTLLWWDPYHQVCPSLKD